MNAGMKQLKASAGSGKTFSLTEKFLRLLAGAEKPDTNYICSRTAPPAHAWPDILAMTFTNKAAAEMKERIVGALKRTALGLDDGQRADWEPEKARQLLERILRRYHQLNIRTIDSLLNLLLRIFALEAGVPPDFELVFEDDDLFTAVLERFQAACQEESSPERDLLEQALDTLLRQEQADGFFVADRLRTRIQEMIRHLRAEGGEFCTDQEELKNLLRKPFDSFQRAVQALDERIQSKQFECNKNFLKFLAKCHDVQLLDAPPESAFASKPELADCVNKNSKGLVTQEDDVLYARFTETLDRFRREGAIIGGAFRLAPALRLAELLMDRLERVERERGQVYKVGMERMVLQQLTEGGGAPDAFCRLGGRLHHLLVDEFQDTSRDQWAVVTPLAEECLSKGGSLFYVGDVKQAIYGWRGGDAKLFDEIPQQHGLAEIAERNERASLPHNWRSRERIVAFNNSFFTRLADTDLNAELAAACLGDKASPDDIAALARAMGREFHDAHQSMPPESNAHGGYVRVERLDNADDPEGAALDALETRLLDTIAGRRPWKDVAVLVRTHAQAALVCDRLVARGVPVITENSLRLDRHPVVRQLAALLNFLEWPENDPALAEFLLGEELFLSESGLNADQMHDWLAMERRRGQPLWKALRESFPDQWQHILRPLASKSGLMTPYDLTAEILERFRVLQRYPGAELYVRRFLEILHRAGEQGLGSLSAFLSFWSDKSGEEKVPLPENVDAVRIMTIHKSKGLEFPVVLAPFHNWARKNDADLICMDLYGKRMLTRCTKALGVKFQARKRDGILEDLHMLYVAWTRPREELYVWYAPPKPSAPVAMAMELALELSENNPVMEYGQEPVAAARPLAPPEAKPVLAVLPPVILDDEGEPQQPPSWQRRLRVYRHMEKEVLDLSARLRGDVAHRAMERLRVHGHDAQSDKEDARHAAQAALLEFPTLALLSEAERSELERDVTEMVRWAMGRPELRQALHEGLREADMLGESGEDQLYRADMILFGPDESIVFDFKTGQRDPEHHIQVRRYMNLIAAMTPDRPVRGTLIYLDLRETEAVIADGGFHV